MLQKQKCHQEWCPGWSIISHPFRKISTAKSQVSFGFMIGFFLLPFLMEEMILKIFTRQMKILLLWKKGEGVVLILQ